MVPAKVTPTRVCCKKSSGTIHDHTLTTHTGESNSFHSTIYMHHATVQHNSTQARSGDQNDPNLRTAEKIAQETQTQFHKAIYFHPSRQRSRAKTLPAVIN